MDANNFMREGRLSIGAISQAMGIEQNALMEFVQNALNAVPAPVVQAILPAINQDQPEVEEENDTISFVKSERGKDKAVHRGFQFQKHKTNKNGSTQYWQCVKYQTLNGGCKARLTTLTAGDVFSKLLPHDGNRLHNHALDPMAVPKSNIMANLKRRALDTRELPKELLNHELQTAPLALGPSLTDSATRKIIRNYRKAHQIPVVEASNVQNLTFSDASKMYVDAAGQEQLFVLKDSGRKDPQRIVLLGKERNIDWSVEMKITYWDGSFSITPAPFYQVYAILAERTSRDSNGGKWVFPVMYALLMDKSAESYIKMMQMLKEVWPLFNPTTISMDFEQGAIQSALQLFPNAMIAGCLFHLVKNFKKKINRAGLTARYHDPEFSIRARMIMSLAFVPPDNIWRDFEVLRAHLLQYDQALAPVLNWFRRNYVGTAMNPPGFPVNWWSCYERTLTGEDRTNNYAEAAHRRLQDALGVDHPTVGRLLQDLKRIQRNHDTHYEQYLAGQDAPKKRRIYLDADRRILAKVHLYEGANLIEYLRGLAHNIVMDQ